jgi:hypothetical protein
MKLSNEALVEIIAIVQDGLLGVKDASEGLRELDLAMQGNLDAEDAGKLTLTATYKNDHPRAGTWEEETTEPN